MLTSCRKSRLFALLLLLALLMPPHCISAHRSSETLSLICSTGGRQVSTVSRSSLIISPRCQQPKLFLNGPWGRTRVGAPQSLAGCRLRWLLLLLQIHHQFSGLCSGFQKKRAKSGAEVVRRRKNKLPILIQGKQRGESQTQTL